MDLTGYLVLSIYVLVVLVICVYGLHRYWMVWLYLRARRRPVEGPARPFDALPRVTVQLPMFNEKFVAERIIEAAAALDYPRDRLQIQVLDDSTDESAGIARRCCLRLAEQGVDIAYIHRTNRDGYKAGALAHGLTTATGEFVAVFDADFVPNPDSLQRTIHYFTEEQVGMVQMRWAHLNRSDSLLTQAQAMCLDGHFVIEQAARAAHGRWFNFNGTAGVWRRTCIDDAGGWCHDTLTEDTDLSYRAQMKGWRFEYRPEITCPAELPPTMSAFITQQHRWNKGLIQTAIKLLPSILRSRAPLGTKIEAWFHLTSPIVHLAILMLVVMLILALHLPMPYGELGLSQLGSGGLRYAPLIATSISAAFLVLGTIAASVFYVASQRVQGGRWVRTLALIPVLMAIGVGISFANSRAVIEALMGRQSPFVRTPKYAGEKEAAADPAASRRRRWLPAGLVELAFAGVLVTCLIETLGVTYALVGSPFVLLFAAGFLAVGLPRLAASWRQSRAVRLVPALAGRKT